ncbi:transcriptional regulator, LacI family [Pseudarthrobacter chlorophenolicus A6]|uniref:Transcriptional regulator, LacI family n=1 Tax=Pseudarthrobacter chlorophenolicus (strain ATCC 700700 / DSM 12829 / CIP 107037 / JCM 12360 / KCTC 9906 / NCIMB 13794 / A6) TaxID=452863 RepID=B8HGR7_PSECP|nr:LacI family DNA-binding transcriptional regulator [Pseudarthrobacter chlorophenolicus]ACL41333.1 transcriptional regulator, LacI family [Pseudarthrobacter chlorophenolicus A6]SDQ66063.1 transcriptional regulator, LacI family [Pseudarthrobacter chlorophenolicus]
MEPAATGNVVTLKDVAAASGVSISTASRALDERTTSRSAAAVNVRKIAEELGYRRNSFASSLRRGETRTLGVLVPRLSDTVMALMFEELERAASSRGYFAMVATSGDDPVDERRAAETLLDRNVDGLILATARLDDELPRLLRERRVVHALVLRTDGVSPSALGDDELGGYLAVRHLLDLGHRDIAVVTGPDFTSTANARLAGARKAMDESGKSLPGAWTLAGGYGIENGFEAGEQLLGTTNRPTAIFAANDNIAMGIMAAAHRHSLRIGPDLSLVGYNDTPLAARLPTPLTSVRVPLDQIARTAIDLLTHPDTEMRVRISTPTLIPRDSTAPPPP